MLWRDVVDAQTPFLTIPAAAVRAGAEVLMDSPFCDLSPGLAEDLAEQVIAGCLAAIGVARIRFEAADNDGRWPGQDDHSASSSD